MSWELPPWVEPTRYQGIDPDEVQKGDIIGTADVNHSPFVVEEVDWPQKGYVHGQWTFHGIDTNCKQHAATFRRPGQKVRRYIRTAVRPRQLVPLCTRRDAPVTLVERMRRCPRVPHTARV
jgi:hypothetical protein